MPKNLIEEQRAKVEGELRKLEAMSSGLTRGARTVRDSAFARFPIIFVLLSTFGFVATLYGLEKLIDTVPLLAERPFLVFALGLATLVFTGSLYKKLN